MMKTLYLVYPLLDGLIIIFLNPYYGRIQNLCLRDNYFRVCLKLKLDSYNLKIITLK